VHIKGFNINAKKKEN